MRPAAMGVCRNPLRGLRPQDMQPVEAGRALLELKPEAQGLLICKLNGEIIPRLTDSQRSEVDRLRRAGATSLADLRLREHATSADNWAAIRVGRGDVIEWHDEPGNRDQTRLALQIAIVAFAWWNPLGWSAGAIGAFAVGANIAIGLLLPPRQPSAGQAAGGVFSASLAGNSARLDDPIPKLCGRVKVTPPYACMPYGRYEASDPADPTHNCDQYFNALFCIGIGNHEIEKVMIGKTSIAHFQDVVVDQYLAPGEQPSRVRANTVVSTEIAGSELDSKEVDGVFQSRYVGGIAVSRPRDRVSRISVDVGADQGLGKTASDGDSESRTAQWQVESREIDDYGRPVSEWNVLANESRTDDTNTPQRWTTDYDLSAPVRPETRLCRTDLKGTSANIRDGIQWIGLRGELEGGAPLNASAAHHEIVMRGSDQLSQYSQKDFSVIARALSRTWDPDTGWSADEVFHRNPGWWTLDCLRGPVLDEADTPRWGLNFPDDRIDLQSFADWAATCDLRQDRFDYAFVSRMDGWEAVQLIARAGRARVFRRNGLISVARDELVEAPVAAFTPRNTYSMEIDEELSKREQADGIVAQFLSNVSWDIESIECPAPGRKPSGEWGTLTPAMEYDSDLVAMSNPVVRFYPGITGAFHAEREGLFDAADSTLRRTTAKATVEMEGAVLAFMDPVRLMPEYTGYGQSGDVAFWDPDTLVMGLSEAPDWASGALFLTLRRDDGTLTDPVEVTAGPGSNDVVLPAAPDFDLVLDAADRGRPLYLLGQVTTGDEIAKVVARTDGGREEGAQLYDLAFLIDDDRVHERDNPLLPGPGDLQDPIDSGTDYPDDDAGGGFAVLVRMQTVGIQGGNSGVPDDTHRGGLARFILRNDGHAAWYAEADSDGSPNDAADFVGMWLNATVDPSVAGTYEAFMELVAGSEAFIAAGAVLDGTLGTWLALDSDREWSWSADNAVSDALFAPESITAVLRLSIRKVGGSVVLATRYVSLVVRFDTTVATGAEGAVIGP